VERVVEEVEERHGGSEHHHHHHHDDDAIAGVQMLLEALNSRVTVLETKISNQGLETARLYKVLAHIVEALMAESEEEKRRSLLEALKVLEEGRGDLER